MRRATGVFSPAGKELPLPVIFISAVLMVFSVVSCRPAEIKEETILLTVSDEPVIAAEYLHIFSGLKSEVYSYFSLKYGSQMNKDFWIAQYGEETPVQMLKARTLDKLKIIKTEQSLFREHGIASDISYPCFIKELNAENERRKKAAELKLPFYGPLEYDEKTYYEYLNAERRSKLMIILSKGELAISDGEILYYHNNTEGFRDMDIQDTREQIIRALTGMKYDKLISQLASGAVLEQNRKEIDRAASYFLEN